MSKRIEAPIQCNNCHHQFNFTLYRSIWGEYPENRELVMSDQINVATCPSCGQRSKLAFPFIYTNVKQFFAVWWEPVHDPQIDRDKADYEQLLGPNNYLAAAPRVKDWEEFKATIIQFENGELKGNPGQMPSPQALFGQKPRKKGLGCMGLMLVLVFTALLAWG